MPSLESTIIDSIIFHKTNFSITVKWSLILFMVEILKYIHADITQDSRTDIFKLNMIFLVKDEDMINYSVSQ